MVDRTSCPQNEQNRAFSTNGCAHDEQVINLRAYGGSAPGRTTAPTAVSTVALAMDDRLDQRPATGRSRRPRPIVWLRTHPASADIILATFLTVTSVIFHLLDFEIDDLEYTEPAWWTVLLVIASILPIAWRRVRPVEVALFVVGSEIITSLADIGGTGFIGVIVALYSLGAHAHGSRRTRSLAFIVAGLVLLFAAGFVVDEVDVGDLISSAVILVTAFVLGDNLRRRRDAALALQERLERAERERELIARQHVTDERTRIARELHDVVAHSVSVMVIHAAAARRNLAASPEIAEEALTNIEETGRQTMHELRGVLGVLRNDDADDAERTMRAPQPVLRSVAALVDASDDLPISLEVSGGLDDLASSVDLTGYRIIQEALTNVRRHAGPVTSVDIRIERRSDAVHVVVDDDGRGASAEVRGAGFGIVGMVERVDAIGGTIDAGWRSGGGWRVSATLPTEPVRVAVP